MRTGGFKGVLLLTLVIVSLMVPATLTLTIPENAASCTEDNITVIATSQVDNTVGAENSCIAHAVEPREEIRTVIYPAADVYASSGYETGYSRSQLKFDIRNIPSGSNILSAKLWLYRLAVDNWDGGIVLNRVDNQVWDETITASEFDAQTLTNEENQASKFLSGGWDHLDVLNQLNVDYGSGHAYASFRLRWANDNGSEPSVGIDDGRFLVINSESDALSVVFRSSEYDGNEPYLEVVYPLPYKWNLIETWAGTIKAPIGWQTIETWSGTIHAPVIVEWELVETWDGNAQAPAEWASIESWTGMIEASAEWDLIEEWRGAIEAPATWQLVEEWDGDVEAPANWALIESWSGIIEVPANWELMETWNGIVQAPAEWQLIENWDGAVEPQAQWQLIETWTRTVEAPAEWQLIEIWTGTVKAPTEWQLIETWTETIEAPVVWKLIETWTGTIETPAVWQLIEVWTGTVEAPDTQAPPVPTLVSPTDGTTTDDTTPTFDWSDVTDPSGVTYTLEIGTLTKTGLTTSTYTLTSGEALSDGNYSWRVRAVDGASNAGDWSDAWTLKVETVPSPPPPPPPPPSPPEVDDVPPPVPSLISPADGENITDNTPSLDWSGVSDPSGVTYDLTIAKDAGFTSIVLQKTNLTASAYELTSDEALTIDTYYWYVCGVDGAKNVGSWSENWSFTYTEIPNGLIENESPPIDIPSITTDENATIDVENTAITGMTIVVGENVENVRITVQQLTDKPAEIAIGAPGVTYTYLNIVSENITDADIDIVLINFRVEKAWITAEDIDPDSIVMLR